MGTSPSQVRADTRVCEVTEEEFKREIKLRTAQVGIRSVEKSRATGLRGCKHSVSWSCCMVSVGSEGKAELSQKELKTRLLRRTCRLRRIQVRVGTVGTP